MARTSRKNMENSSFFHIMVQGINKETIFIKEEEKEEYLKLINKNSEELEIIAYCIMDNHAHFLIKTHNPKSIESWMRKANTAYAIFYNKTNDRVGYVFRNRYKIQVIKNINHLYKCVKYIHENPVKAEVCKNKEEYKYSSYNKIYQSDNEKIYNKLKEILDNDIIEFENSNFKLLKPEKENKEKICCVIINEFLIKNQIRQEVLRKEKDLLKKLINLLKNEKDISYRIIEKYLKISREKLRRINLEE